MEKEQMSECIWCGKKFSKVRQTKLYCSKECGKKYWDDLRRSVYKKRHRKTANEELVEVAAEARDAGMTYGQYVAKKYIEEMQRNAVDRKGSSLADREKISCARAQVW